MDQICDKFHHGRTEMIQAFVQLSDAARRAGMDEDEISQLHGRFFDGNVITKDAFRVAALLARLA